MAARRIAGAAALALLAALLAAGSCAGRDFYVGGRGGWAPNPAEPFNSWAERNRFLVNDTLVFRYDRGADAVLQVSQGHYDACNATDPVLRLDGAAGVSRFVFRASGPYFFIGADAGRCRAGEHLIVVVLAVRDKGNSTSSSPTLPPPPKSSPSSTPPPPPKSSPSPPPVAMPSQRPLPTPPPQTPAPENNNASSPSLTPVPEPAPAPGKNGTSSSAPALRVGVLACLLIGGVAILV